MKLQAASDRHPIDRLTSSMTRRRMMKMSCCGANNGEGFSHDPGPRDVPVRLLPVRDRAVEAQFNLPGRNVRIRATPETLR